MPQTGSYSLSGNLTILRGGPRDQAYVALTDTNGDVFRLEKFGCVQDFDQIVLFHDSVTYTLDVNMEHAFSGGVGGSDSWSINLAHEPASGAMLLVTAPAAAIRRRR